MQEQAQKAQALEEAKAIKLQEQMQKAQALEEAKQNSERVDAYTGGYDVDGTPTNTLAELSAGKKASKVSADILRSIQESAPDPTSTLFLGDPNTIAKKVAAKHRLPIENAKKMVKSIQIVAATKLKDGKVSSIADLKVDPFSGNIDTDIPTTVISDNARKANDFYAASQAGQNIDLDKVPDEFKAMVGSAPKTVALNEYEAKAGPFNADDLQQAIHDIDNTPFNMESYNDVARARVK